MSSYEIRPSNSFGGSLLEFVLLLCVLGAFLIVVSVVFIVRTFVRYSHHAALWIALAVCVACALTAGIVYKLTQFSGSGVLAGMGVAVLLITCFAVDLKNRDTLLPEKTSLVDQVLHSSWWGSDDKPLESEREQLAA